MIINTGIKENATTFDKRRVQLVNFIAIVSIIGGTLAEAFTLFESGFIFISFIPYFVGILLLAGLILLNASHRYSLSRALLALIANSSLIFHFIVLDESLRASIFHLVNYIIYVAIFRKYKSIFFWSSITLLIFFVGTYLQVYDLITPVFVPDDTLVPLYRFVYLTVTSILIVSLTLFFKKVNEDHQKALSKSNEKLEGALATINKQNKKLKLNVEEKEIILQEVHHRVKNNLQVIASVIDLQMDKDMDVASHTLLDECKNRVNAMALVHEKLYQSDQFDRVNLKEYISGLMTNISQSHLNLEVQIILKINNIKLNMDNTIQLGLIVNELVTNAFKYAFNGEKGGKLTVSLNKKGKSISLVVQDNGKGLPENYDLEADREKQLGLTLVRLLSKQLNGNSNFQNKSGLRVSINFDA